MTAFDGQSNRKFADIDFEYNSMDICSTMTAHKLNLKACDTAKLALGSYIRHKSNVEHFIARRPTTLTQQKNTPTTPYLYILQFTAVCIA